MREDKILENLQKRIEQVKERKKLKVKAMESRELAKSRAARNRLIFKLGGMVEKMGLDKVDEATLLGCFLAINKQLEHAQNATRLHEAGKPYLEVGKKLGRPQMATERPAEGPQAA